MAFSSRLRREEAEGVGLTTLALSFREEEEEEKDVRDPKVRLGRVR